MLESLIDNGGVTMLEFLIDNGATLFDAGLGALALKMYIDQRKILRMLADKDEKHETRLEDHEQRLVVLERKVA